MKLIFAVLTLSISPLLAIEGNIPVNSKIYIGPMNGFGTYIMAAMANKKVPLVIVADRDQADFEAAGDSESEKPGWARTIFLGQGRSNEQASINVVNVQTGTIVFAYAVNKVNSVRGKQSAAEACAKHLKKAMLKK